MFPQSFLEKRAVVSVTVGVFVLGALAFYFFRSGNIEVTTSDAAKIVVNAGEQITVDARSKTGQAKTPLIGFVHGVTYDSSKDYSRAIGLLNALAPRFWRLSGYNGVYDFVVNAAQFPKTHGTSVTVNLQDFFNQKYGLPIRVDPACSAAVDSCFASYAELKSTWSSFADAFMKIAVSQNFVMDYFDVFSEPNWGWENVTSPQLLELFAIAHDTARRHRPDIKIVAPSIGGIESDSSSFLRVFVPFLDYVVADGLRVDAISWHEFGYPEEVVSRAAEMRRLIAERPALCKPACPEIHINEYAGPESHLVPGVNVGWLYYLEKAGVDQAHRACWDDLGSFLRKWSSCWAGFNGMLMDDDETPQPTYWVYRAYAEIAGIRVPVETSGARIVALASRDDPKKEIRILAGKYGAAAGKVIVAIEGYPYGGRAVTAELRRIPNYGSVVRAMPGPPAAEIRTIPVKRDSVSIEIENFQDGEAYSIIVRLQ